MSCHFVVLLIKHFKDQYPKLTIILHLTRSYSCEMFFSKIGGMVGMECAYDFLKLVNCTNTFNHVHAIEYGENGFKFGKVHNKMENVWVALHPLQEGESIANLAYYNLIMLDDDVIQALIDIFKNVQNMLTTLNMKGSPTTRGHDSSWFNEPWKGE
jgi:hypothetical protein